LAVVLSGPSGAGKSSLIRELLRVPGRRLSVSATTRAPRPGEIDGVHYRFVNRDAFRRLIDEGRLLEWAEVYGNFYGTPLDEVERHVAAGTTVFLDVDSQGFRSVRRVRPGTPGIFVSPPSLEELERRLRARASDAEETIRKRLAEAAKETAAAGEYDHVVVNDDLTRAVREVESLLERFARPR
jgi:guanylate kinase